MSAIDDRAPNPLSEQLRVAAKFLDMKPQTNSDAETMRTAADYIDKLDEANAALSQSLYVAWNALNEIRRDAADTEADVYKAIDAYAPRACAWIPKETHKS